jgi:hypothetical protein
LVTIRNPTRSFGATRCHPRGDPPVLPRVHIDRIVLQAVGVPWPFSNPIGGRHARPRGPAHRPILPRAVT